MIRKKKAPRPSVVLQTDSAVMRRRAIWLAIVVSALLIGGYGLGRWQASSGSEASVEAQRRSLIRSLASRDAEIERLKQRLAQAVVDTEVNKRTYAELRQTLVRYQYLVTGLREEVSIYRGLVAGTDSRTLKIRSWQLYAHNDDRRRYRYRLVIQQRSMKGVEVEGLAQVTVIGRDADGKELTLPFDTLSRQHTQPQIELRFSHFQVIEGELALPAGFRPERVQVTARTSEPVSSQVRKRYAWSVQEVAEDVGKA